MFHRIKMETNIVNTSVRYPKRLIYPKLVNDETDKTPVNQRMQDINEKIKEAKRKFLETLEKRRTDKTWLYEELKYAIQPKGNGLQESDCAQSSTSKASTSSSVEYKESTVVNDEPSIPQGYQVPPKAPSIPNLLELNKPANTINSLEIYCSDCDCYCTKDFYYNQHLSNFPHSSFTLLITLYPPDIVNYVYKIRGPNDIQCIPCNVFMKSPGDVTGHVNGTKHARKLNFIFPEFASKNLGKPPKIESVPAKKSYCAKCSKLETSSQAAPKSPSTSNLTKTNNTALSPHKSPNSSMKGFQSSHGYQVPPKAPSVPNLLELNKPANTINSLEIHCSDCDCYCTRDLYYNQHLYNFPHASITLLKTQYPADILNSLYKVRSANGIQCIPCNVFMKSPDDMTAHVNGTKHAKKLNSIFPEFAPKNLGKPPKRGSVPAKTSYCAKRSKLETSSQAAPKTSSASNLTKTKNTALNLCKSPNSSMKGFQSSHEIINSLYFVRSGFEIFCLLCNVRMKSDSEFNSHVNGSWHKQYMKKFPNSSI